MWISLHHQDTDFTWPLSLEDKITIFLDRTSGWQLDIAERCINDKAESDGNVISKAIPGSDFAVLHIILSYFEAIAKFHEGFDQRGRSEYYFKEGVFLIFPDLKKYPQDKVNELLDVLYSGGRSGLYHGGMTDPRIWVTRELQTPMTYDSQSQRLVINAQRLVAALKVHLEEYGRQLKDPKNIRLRENFERRYDFASSIETELRMPTTLIRNGHIITASDDYFADVLIDGDKIKMIGSNLPVQADHTIDARGKYVIPGGVDCHTHMELNVGAAVSSDDFETGTIAAAHGGTTTIIDFPTQARGKTMHAAFDEWMAKAEPKAAIDFGFHITISYLPDDLLPEMDALVREGVTSFKMFTAYPDRLQLDDGTILKAMQRTGANGGFIMIHAENGSVIDYLVQKFIAEGKTTPNYHLLSRPHQAEADATHRVILLSELAGVPVYIVHVSSHMAMEAIRAARDRGLPAYGETCPQYLWLAYEQYADGSFDGARFVCSPPIRERANQEPLWRALAADDLQTVATDHCPFCMKEGFKGLPKQKELGIGNFAKIPNGVPGVENRMHLVYQGGVVQRGWSMSRFVQVTSTAPAKIFGLFPRKGTIAVGSDADIVLWDPQRQYTIRAATHFMRVDYNPYEGVTIDGSPSLVMSRGRVIFEDDKFLGKPGQGQYLKRGTYALL